MIDKLAESFLIIALILSIATIYSYIYSTPNFFGIALTNLIIAIIPIIYNSKIAMDKIIRTINKILNRDKIIFKEKKNTYIISRGGFLIFIAIIWLIFGIIASIPFFLKTGKLEDSLFEAFSAITTTGLSVIKGLDQDLYLYRALLEWIGGLGITSFLLSILRGVTGKYLANYSGFEYDYKTVFKNIFIIYLIFTVLVIVSLYITGLDLMNAVLLGLVSVSNGGFEAMKEELSLEQKYIVGLGMLSLSITAIFYLTGKEIGLVALYLGYLLIISLAAYFTGLEINDAILLTLSTATSGGYSLVNPELKDIHIFIYSIAMLIGGMTISTAGGIKLNRLFGAIIGIRNYLFSKFYNSKSKIINEPLLIIILFIFIYLTTILVHLVHGYELKESIFNSASITGNCGYSLIDYSDSSIVIKIYIIFVMYITRIEIIPFLVLLFKLFKG